MLINADSERFDPNNCVERCSVACQGESACCVNDVVTLSCLYAWVVELSVFRASKSACSKIVGNPNRSLSGLL